MFRIVVATLVVAGVANAICSGGAKFDDETGAPCRTARQPSAASVRNNNGVAEIKGTDIIFKTEDGNYTPGNLAKETADVKTTLLAALDVFKVEVTENTERAAANSVMERNTLKDALLAAIAESSETAGKGIGQLDDKLTAKINQNKATLENVIQTEINAKLQPLTAWKVDSEACYKKGQILGSGGCTTLYATCDEVKSNGAYSVPTKTEFIPGLSLDITCVTGYYQKTKSTIDCLTSGKYSKAKGSSGYYGAVCEKCKVADCAECVSGVDKCSTCGKNSKGQQLTLVAGKCLLLGSCQDVKNSGESSNGLYELTAGGKTFTTYCDFKVKGGGWQLVASVHEDNLGAKCNAGDLWTNTNGNNGRGNKGLGNWQSNSVFNEAKDACKKDFKSEGYTSIPAQNIMIWHVPNGRDYGGWYDAAIYRMYSTTNFLNSWGKTLQSLYTKKPPISQAGSCNSGKEGPNTRIVWDKGSASNFYWNDMAPNSRGEVSMGYIDFTAYNNERAVNAMCPGVRYRGCNAEHACIGGGGYFPEGGGRQCSDFSGWDWNGFGTHRSWSPSRRLATATVLIFTR